MLGRVVAAPAPEYRGINVSWLTDLSSLQGEGLFSFEANEIGDACMQAITGAVHFCFIVWPSTLSVEEKQIM